MIQSFQKNVWREQDTKTKWEIISLQHSIHLQETLRKKICGFSMQNTNPLKKSCLLSFPDCTSWCNNWPMWSRVIWLRSSVDSTPTRTNTGSRFWALSSSTHCMASCGTTHISHPSTEKQQKRDTRVFPTVTLGFLVKWVFSEAASKVLNWAVEPHIITTKTTVTTIMEFIPLR